MRLDKFLQVTRLVKRRSKAQELCENGSVIIRDHPAKSSAEVKPGDILKISIGNRMVEVKVLSVPQRPTEKDVEILSERKLEE